MGDLPPMYSRFSLPSNQSVPVYTACPHQQERVLHSEPASPISSRDSNEREYSYATDHLEIKLGRMPWGLQYAAYGREGTVNGTIKFIKNCSHVLQVTVKLLGNVTNTVSEHATVAMPGVTKKNLVSKEVVLFGSESGVATLIQVHRQFHFAIPFPLFIDGGMAPLPPSYTGFHLGATSEVTYTLQVDIIRKGLRRHEMRSIPVLFLPKNRPCFPPMVELPIPLPGPRAQAGVNMVALSPVWPDNQRPANASEDLPTIHLMLPVKATFASGDPIPVGLILSCLNAPAIPKLLTPNVEVFLIKRRKMWVSGGRQISVRERLVSKAEEFHSSDLQEGSRYLNMEIQAGQFGSESSWKVDDAVVVEYFIRVIVRPPAYAKHIPIFRLDAPVELTTDQYGSLERELLTMNGLPTPAIGLMAVQSSSRR